MEQKYASNSHKSKRQEEKEIPVKKEMSLSGKARTVSKTGLFDTFFNNDIQTVKEYILTDVVFPTIKKALYDVISNGSSMLLFGEETKVKSSPGSRISYSSFYDRDKGRRDEPRTTKAKAYDDIIFDNRGDAELVLSGMEEIIARYGFTSISDMYELAEVSAPEWTSNKYGWSNLSRASVKVTRDGYILSLPKAMPID